MAPLEIGVVCGHCDRFSALGSAKCVCGEDLALGGEPVERQPAPAVQAQAGISEPPPTLFGKNDLRPRRPPSGARVEAAAAVSARAQTTDSALSSSGALGKEGSDDDSHATLLALSEPALD